MTTERWLKRAPFDYERRRRRKAKTGDHSICRWCGASLPKRRTAWCSDNCKREFWVRASANDARRYIFERDKGVCAACGTDTVAANGWVMRMRGWYIEHERFGEWIKLKLAVLGTGDARSRGIDYWDADHILEVEEGGGCCGLDNYQTLCIPCHKKKTAMKRKQDAAMRRAEAKLEPGAQVEIGL